MANHTHKPRRTFGQRLVRFIIANAITLSIVFALALPLSYIAGQRIIRARQIDKLSHTDAQVFDEGLGYLLPRAVDDDWALDAAIEHIDTLPSERATRLLAGLGAAFALREEPIPDVVFDAGGRLLERVDFAQKFVVYNYLTQFGRGEDPRVVAALASTLETPDDRRFMQAVEFYDTQFLWLPEHVPAEHWLRWALLLSHSDAALTQLRAAQVLGEAIASIDDPRIAEGLLRLAGSDNPAVRSEALDAAAGFAKVADDPVPYEQVLIALTTDENETLARRAWITLGLLNPLSGFSADWRSVEPPIAEAMLWAVVKTNPDRPEPAREAFAVPEMSTAALMALSLDPGFDFEVLQAAWHASGYDTRRLIFPNTTTQWRSLLALNASEETWRGFAEYIMFTSTMIDKASQESEDGLDPALRQKYLAYCYSCSYRLNSYFRMRLWESLTDYENHLLLLSTIEGMRYAPVLMEPPLDYLPSTNIFAQLCGGMLGVVEVDFDTLRDQVGLDSPVARDLFALGIAQYGHRTADAMVHSHTITQRLCGVVAAGLAERTPQLIEGITGEFIRNHRGLDRFDLHSYTDAQLTDLGLRRVDALTTLLDIAESAPDRANRYEQIALLKLALWMRGDLGDEFTPEAERMLDDDRLPTSTVLMCLLHMQRPAALYYLFNNPDAPGNAPLDIYDLFVNQRWWHVFSRLVPDADLELWLWGDPGAQSFQFEVMRQWVQVNRWRLEGGWWPGGVEEPE